MEDLIRDQCNDFLTDTTTNTRPETSGTVSITAANLGNAFIPAQIAGIHTTDEPNTIRFTPQGDLLVIRSGVAFTLSPYPADDDAFNAGLSGAGLTGELADSGVLMLELGNGAMVAVRFHNFAKAGGTTAGFAASNASFTMASSDPAAHAYKILVSYPDGTTQTMSPAVHDIPSLSDLLTGFGLAYQFRSDGNLDLLNASGQTIWRGTPDMALRPAKTGVFDPYVKSAGDVDGNGKNDYEFNTTGASQYIFAVPF